MGYMFSFSFGQSLSVLTAGSYGKYVFKFLDQFLMLFSNMYQSVCVCVVCERERQKEREKEIKTALKENFQGSLPGRDVLKASSPFLFIC
jgi:hypothetical protein